MQCVIGGYDSSYPNPPFKYKCLCDCVYKTYTPVRAPWDGGDKADIREKDGVIFDAIQGIVHLTEWQSVQLELELHLTQR